MRTIYMGLAGQRIAPDLAVDDAPESRTFGWLFARHPDGQWVTVADLRQIIRALSRAESAPEGGKDEV